MLALLPPFHSFGLLGNVIAPVLGGIRTVYHPDPTDAAGLVRTMAQYRATLLISTPTFLSYMLAIATPDDLRSVRIDCQRRGKMPGKDFRAGGRTGAASGHHGGLRHNGVLARHCREPPGTETKRGTVGRPVAGVEVCVVDPESRQPLGTDAAGLLLVRGPSVFHGYLAYEGPDPFWEVAGKRWYNTGDLVEIDRERYIRFCGRLKRFLKAGGEMISLPALEEPFAERYPPGENGPQVAVEGIETPRGAMDRALHNSGNLAAAGECTARRGGVSRSNARGRSGPPGRDPLARDGEDGLQNPPQVGDREGPFRRNVERLTVDEKAERSDIGDVYLWTSLDQETKLCPCSCLASGLPTMPAGVIHELWDFERLYDEVMGSEENRAAAQPLAKRLCVHPNNDRRRDP